MSMKVLGEEHQDTLLVMNALDATYRDMKRLDDAQCLHERATAVRKKFLGEGHPDTLWSMTSLASTMWDQMPR